MLYDARFTSSNGEASCSSCHVFGDNDSLAWDLSNPDDDVLPNDNPFEFEISSPPRLPSAEGPDDDAEPARHGALRSDALARRPAAPTIPAASTPDALDEVKAFKRFNPAFVGARRPRDAAVRADMAFTDHPDRAVPPNRDPRLDNVLTTAQQAGAISTWTRASSPTRCAAATASPHPDPRRLLRHQRQVEPRTNQLFKVAHLRNAYTKVGGVRFPTSVHRSVGPPFQGEQIAASAFCDGSVDTVFRTRPSSA